VRGMYVVRFVLCALVLGMFPIRFDSIRFDWVPSVGFFDQIQKSCTMYPCCKTIGDQEPSPSSSVFVLAIVMASSSRVVVGGGVRSSLLMLMLLLMMFSFSLLMMVSFSLLLLMMFSLVVLLPIVVVVPFLMLFGN